MKKPDFVVVGSSGGGATIAWTLAKQGFEIVILEQGGDIAAETHRYASESSEVLATGQASEHFNERVHDEYHFQRERPAAWRQMRGEYNTFRLTDDQKASPLKGMGGHTASVLGGGSVLWGTWSYRATPIDFRLGSMFDELDQRKDMEEWGYAIADWPISYSELEPYYNLSEALLGVSGDRSSITEAIKKSKWYAELSKLNVFKNSGSWDPQYPFPRDPVEQTPVGHFIAEGFDNVDKKKFGDHSSFALPSGLLAPGYGKDGGNTPYCTRDEISKAIEKWPRGAEKPEFWRQSPDALWSDAERDACNMCGYCGGFLCWGKHSPKGGSRGTTLEEIKDLPNVTVITHAKAIEVLYESRLRRATGVRYLDTSSDPSQPRVREVSAHNVVLSCGAVQSARLLFLSGEPGGLGNRHDQLGRNVTFHMFDLLGTFYLPVEYEEEMLHGLLHGEFGHTGNTASFGSYLVQDEGSYGHKDMWCKAGTFVSTAKHNPMGDAMRKISSGKGGLGTGFLSEISRHARKLQLRLTSDDLPMPQNRVDLDPSHVDEYGMPVARITRQYGEHEQWVGRVMKGRIAAILGRHKHLGGHKYRAGDVRLIGAHQHGTCRMGDDPTKSVLDRNCRVHGVQNLFVVDTACFPTGFGLNPMVTVVANALRVGTWIGKEM